jgi:hypothetical protein
MMDTLNILSTVVLWAVFPSVWCSCTPMKYVIVCVRDPTYRLSDPPPAEKQRVRPRIMQHFCSLHCNADSEYKAKDRKECVTNGWKRKQEGGSRSLRVVCSCEVSIAVCFSWTITRGVCMSLKTSFLSFCLRPFEPHINISVHVRERARGSIVVKALCYKPEGLEFETKWGEWIFSIYLILPIALGPGVHSASNRNKYHK